MQALAPAAAKLQSPAERQAADRLLRKAAGQLLRELPQGPAMDAARQPSPALRQAMAAVGLAVSSEAGASRAAAIGATLDAAIGHMVRAGAVMATSSAGPGACGRSNCTACGHGRNSVGGWVMLQVRRSVHGISPHVVIVRLG